MGFDRETALEMKKIAGKYYLCNLCRAEIGSWYAVHNFGPDTLDHEKLSDGKKIRCRKAERGNKRCLL